MVVAQDNRSSSRLVRFGVFEADLRAGELRKNGLKIRLPGQPFEVLAVMLDRPGEVITREEFQKRLWPDGTFVDFDHSLNNAINKIREALGDSAESPRFVETLSRRGYRFIAPVECLDPPGAPVPGEDDGRSGLDSSENSPAESSSQLSGNKAVIDPSGASGPVNFSKAPWLSRRARLFGASLVFLVLLAFLFWWFLRLPKPRELVLTRLTTDPGLTTDAVISPDGKLIAFASDRGANNLDIYVRQVSGGDSLRLTSDPADDHQPAFSPDGSQIVFRSERESGGIYLVSALGGQERLLAEKGRNPRFSPLNDWIAFWVGPLAGHPFGAQAGKIFLIPSSGGISKPIDPPGVLAAGCPIWSPDGTHLLFYGSDSKNLPVWYPTSDWWVWPLTGGPAVKTGAFEALAAQSISLTLPSPVPTPGEWVDDRIVFSANTGDSVSLWQVSISPTNWRITGPARRVTSGSGLEVRPSLAKTGLLVFSSLTENADIWGLPIKASQGQANGPPKQLTHDLAADYLPSMSADGKKLSFVSLRSGSPDIWLKDLETDREKALVASPPQKFSARLSPDGSLVSYSSPATGAARASDIYVIAAKGGLPHKVCRGGQLWGWSPDNKFLFFAQHRATVGLINLATGKVANYLQSSEFPVFLANLTHDGRWITFVALDTQASPSRLQVLAVPFAPNALSEEGDWIRVVSDPHYNDKPRWSPDGNRIYFVSDRDGFACLWSQPVEPETKRPVGPPLPLYHIHQVRRSILNVGWGLMDIAVAPDKLVFNLGELTGNIWLTKIAEE